MISLSSAKDFSIIGVRLENLLAAEEELEEQNLKC